MGPLRGLVGEGIENLPVLVGWIEDEVSVVSVVTALTVAVVTETAVVLTRGWCN